MSLVYAELVGMVKLWVGRMEASITSQIAIAPLVEGDSDYLCVASASVERYHAGSDSFYHLRGISAQVIFIAART